MLATGILQTFEMTLISTVFAYVLGLPLGIVLIITAPGGLHPQAALYKALNILVNLVRSVPFLILLIAIVPFTELVVGTSIGTRGAIVPLTVCAFPYVGRLVESSISELDPGIIEAAQSMGASVFQIIVKVMIPESVPSLIYGATIATITILGYSAMAGIVGGGGLGDIAIRYGYYRWQYDLMFVTVVVLVAIVQVLQILGNRFARVTDNRK
jgi:D-methionine transport system permease protein